MADRPAAPARHGDNRSVFDRFVNGVQALVSHPAAFAVVLVFVAVWLVSAPLWHNLEVWQIFIHTVGAVVALLLLVLMRSSARRADEAQDEKLNVIAEGLAALMESRGAEDPELRSAAQKLRDAVGLEERH